MKLETTMWWHWMIILKMMSCWRFPSENRVWDDYFDEVGAS
jgi:hypothetical protein